MIMHALKMNLSKNYKNGFFREYIISFGALYLLSKIK